MRSLSKDIDIKVFMYHRIIKQASGNTKDWHAVSEDNFRKQLKMLDMLNYTPITFEDLQLYLDDKLTLPKKPIILTFDDGHLDTYEVALPILKEFDMKAVVYALGNRNLRYALWDQIDGGPTLPLMTDDQLLEIRSMGFEVGAHSMTHPTLSNLSVEEQIEEIVGSKRSLENLLGENLLSFAYPYGRLDFSSYEITQKAGFKFACGVFTGPPKFGDDIFNIRRLSVGYKTGAFGYLLKLLTPYEYAEWINYKIRYEKSDPQAGAQELDIPNIDIEKYLKGKQRAKSTSIDKHRARR